MDRAKLELTRRGRVLGTAGNHHDGRTMYIIELDGGQGNVQGPGRDGFQRGDRVVLRRYQVLPPRGSSIRGHISWLAVDAEADDPTRPPDSLGRPA